ncbi:hypothetical protein OSTOST_08893, partial [Ostertagia ostertagi]
MNKVLLLLLVLISLPVAIQHMGRRRMGDYEKLSLVLRIRAGNKGSPAERQNREKQIWDMAKKQSSARLSSIIATKNRFEYIVENKKLSHAQRNVQMYALRRQNRSAYRYVMRLYFPKRRRKHYSRNRSRILKRLRSRKRQRLGEYDKFRLLLSLRTGTQGTSGEMQPREKYYWYLARKRSNGLIASILVTKKRFEAIVDNKKLSPSQRNVQLHTLQRRNRYAYRYVTRMYFPRRRRTVKSWLKRRRDNKKHLTKSPPTKKPNPVEKGAVKQRKRLVVKDTKKDATKNAKVANKAVKSVKNEAKRAASEKKKDEKTDKKVVKSTKIGDNKKAAKTTKKSAVKSKDAKPSKKA